MMDKNMLTWLHISDIHFGHGNEARHRVDQKIVCDEILRDAEKVVQDLGPPDLVLVTGDIAFKADPQEYEQASQWLEQLLTTVNADKSRLYLVPGNHDVDRNKALSGPTRKTIHKSLRANPPDLDEYLEKPEELAPIWSKFEAYSDFATAYAAPKLTPNNPYWMCERDSMLGKIVIVGLNTNLLSFDDQDKPNNLALGNRQLQQAIHSQPRERLLLALQHHPPSWLTDGSKLSAMLQDRAHILFCGHVHEQGGLLSNPLHGGSRLELVAGAGHADLGYPPEHAYSWGRLSPAGLDYFPRTWNVKRHQFVSDSNSFEEMRDDAVSIAQSDLPKSLHNWLSQIHQLSTFWPSYVLITLVLSGVLIVSFGIFYLSKEPSVHKPIVSTVGGFSKSSKSTLETLSVPVPPLTNPPTQLRGALESPRQGSSESGIGLIQGWVCAASLVEARIDGGRLFVIGYGSERGDTESICGNSRTGFAMPINWNNHAQGIHNLKVYVDGVEFTNINFYITIKPGVEVMDGW